MQGLEPGIPPDVNECRVTGFERLVQPLECPFFITQAGVDRRDTVRGDISLLRLTEQLSQHLFCFVFAARHG